MKMMTNLTKTICLIATMAFTVFSVCWADPTPTGESVVTNICAVNESQSNSPADHQANNSPCGNYNCVPESVGSSDFFCSPVENSSVPF